MQKKIITLMVTTLLLLNVPCAASAQGVTDKAQKNNNISLSNNKIKKVVQKYFSNNLQSEKELKGTDNSAIEQQSSLAKLNKLQYELKGKINKHYKLNLEYYSNSIQINSISKKDNLIRVDVDNNVRCKYDTLDDESLYSESHILYLKGDNNDFKVERDFSSLDENAKNIEENIANNKVRGSLLAPAASTKNYNYYVENEINDLKNKIDNIDEYFHKIDDKPRNVNLMSARNSGRYNRDAAANWALNNVKSAEEQVGNDCTNFVSKAVRRGGIPTDNLWYPGSNTWIRVIEFGDWLGSRKGYAIDYYPYTMSTRGDVIQFFNKNRGVFSHSVIVTGRSSVGMPAVSAHTYPAYNVPVSNYYPGNPVYSDYRALNIIY
ncbi:MULTISPECIES: amidase domain-containing protein [Clostridium]|uniref:amidase domain-containing protein n=1 Tax=Clostridium TaxID=1485 RepID=UPI0007744CE5|nr:MULTISPECIES: amidase domain-containing protein [Clostridium]AUM94358.1 hypothetical protein RSJ11_03990 [Clostridium sporogenes]AVQ51786.1 hypothetical protein C7M59_02505 [Clostridium botulinum]